MADEVRSVQQTSLEAYFEIRKKMGPLQNQIYEWLKNHGPATNTMISKNLKIPINVVTPRVYELRQMKLVGVAYEQRCFVTGKKAIYWKVVK